MSERARDKIAKTLVDRDEATFQQWIKALPWYSEFQQQYGEAPDLDAPEYDYRAAYQAGITPERSQYDQGRYHWPSQFKAVTHPTMWKEHFMQATGTDPDSPEGAPYVSEFLR